MNKILIKLYVPAVNQTFDVFVPVDLAVRELIKVLVNGVNYMRDGTYISSQKETLSFRKNEGLLNPSLTLADYGVQNGAELVLI